jgi:hypothetical protein
MVNANFENKVLNYKLGPIKCSQEILQLMGNIKKPITCWNIVLPLQK